MIRIRGLQKLVETLQRIDLAPVQQDALEAAGQRLAGSVRELLSHEPGTDHAMPWLRTGELRDSIASEANADEAVVGSNRLIAVYQEHGTAKIPARPFLAPAGTAGAESTAREIGREIADAVRTPLHD